ncbi:AbrB/MazE/SpoVT family DNA-binding domain-containing protein [Methylobacterium indicum]|uniref:AbrB/MazE/SpoVT family DNA-binding domain-containing protein n=1 Tax=Methylobacterium indicum TaxID=1775910 RepID=UPI00243567BB|nr:AbrB/MazE/SpoVT family DNA-binding domain-containing protein [Methylobacterium indicum]
MKALVLPGGSLNLPEALRERHGLTRGGEVLVEDTGEAIVLRTLDQAVARAQALSRRLVAGRSGASVDDFLAARMGDTGAE